MLTRADKKVTSYPYKIPPLPTFFLQTLTHCGSWEALEFFRIEALLRSKKVMEVYRRTYKKYIKTNRTTDKLFASTTDKLFTDFAVHDGWKVLNGSHHKLICIEPIEQFSRHHLFFTPDCGISDLRWAIVERSKPNRESNDLLVRWLKGVDDCFLAERHLTLRIDTAYPPDRILKALKIELERRHKTEKNVSIGKPEVKIIGPKNAGMKSKKHGFQIWVSGCYHPTKKSPIRKIQTWLAYFTCYDLRHCQNLTFGDIAKKVYPPGGSKSRDRAEIAFRRVTKLIKAAEQNKWPPPTM